MWLRRHIVPFRSEAQRKYLWAKHPRVAARFAAESPKGADLPEHVGDSFKHVGSMFGKRKRGK